MTRFHAPILLEDLNRYHAERDPNAPPFFNSETSHDIAVSVRDFSRRGEALAGAVAAGFHFDPAHPDSTPVHAAFVAYTTQVIEGVGASYDAMPEPPELARADYFHVLKDAAFTSMVAWTMDPDRDPQQIGEEVASRWELGPTPEPVVMFGGSGAGDDETADDRAQQYELMQWQRFNAQTREAEAAARDTDEAAVTRHAMTGEDPRRAVMETKALAAQERAEAKARSGLVESGQRPDRSGPSL